MEVCQGPNWGCSAKEKIIKIDLSYIACRQDSAGLGQGPVTGCIKEWDISWPGMSSLDMKKFARPWL
jgi:hypothetical protein